MSAEVITAAGGVIVAVAGLLGIIYKMWHDHTSLAIKVTDALEKNAIASTELKGAVQANTKVMEANTRTTDNFSKLVEDMVWKTKKYKRK